MRLALLLLPFVMACNGFLDVAGPPPPPPGTPILHLVGAFNFPVYLTAPPADSNRVFVVELGGTVRVVRRDTILSRRFLDLAGQITSGGERGLLSLAFDPQYASTGRFYVYFTNVLGDLRIVRYNVSSDPDSADEATADTVLKIPHPVHENHNGGQLQFGPDGMLYVGTGDGGGSGDPDGNAQDKHALLGKLLRLDVSGASGYAIPAGNPFASDTSYAPEIWGLGLRNPWRFSFDRQTGDLYIGDVGQDLWEEVDISPTAVQAGRGVNWGWNVMEAHHCYPSTPCDSTGFVQPSYEYAHVPGRDFCSITGGYVYRGSAIPGMRGEYFFADYCAGFIRSISYPTRLSAVDWTILLSPAGFLSSFGQDARGELYIMSLNGGVYRIIPAP